MQVFTLDQLSQYNGQDGMPVYIAYRGYVYDVSGSYFFRKGRHWVQHSAGCDLSEEIGKAPHDDSLIQKFPIVGTLSR
jgi:predicted heme/steroid binding protein